MPKLQFELNSPTSSRCCGIALTPVFVAFLLSSSLTLRQLSLVVFIVARLTDWYDGWIARRMGYSTRWGKFLDPLADKSSLPRHCFPTPVWGWSMPGWSGSSFSGIFSLPASAAYAELRDQPIVTSRGAQAKTFGEFVVIYYILIFYVIRSIPVVYKEWASRLTVSCTPRSFLA